MREVLYEGKDSNVELTCLNREGIFTEKGEGGENWWCMGEWFNS